MKLRNKKTGKVIEWFNNTDNILPNSLAELNAEWEDAPEEPKGIKSVGNIGSSVHIELGSKEEAEQAVEKLKAWKRLKGWGFKFCGEGTERDTIEYSVARPPLKREGYWTDEIHKCFDLLFGGKE